MPIDPTATMVNPQVWPAFCQMIADVYAQAIRKGWEAPSTPATPGDKDSPARDRAALLSTHFGDLYDHIVRKSPLAGKLFAGPLDEFNLSLAAAVAVMFGGRGAPLPPDVLFRGVRDIWTAAEQGRAGRPNPRIDRLIHNTVHRTPEFLLYYILRYWQAMAAHGTALHSFWQMAWSAFLEYIGSSIRAMIALLNVRTYAGIPMTLPENGWSELIADHLTAATFAGMCHCCLDTSRDEDYAVLEPEARERQVQDPEDIKKQMAPVLNSNQRKKLKRCLEHHHIRGWWADEMLFWHFIQRAVKGLAGAMRDDANANAIIQGIFWSLVSRKDRRNGAGDMEGPLGGPEKWTALRNVKLLVRCCSNRNKPKTGEGCEKWHSNHEHKGICKKGNCKGQFVGPADNDGWLMEDWIILDDLSIPQAGGNGDGDDDDRGDNGDDDRDDGGDDNGGANDGVNAGDADQVQQISQRRYQHARVHECPNCGNDYRADLCHDVCGVHGAHDVCPRCGTPHKMRKNGPPRVSLAFCEHSPMVDVMPEIWMRGLTLAASQTEGEWDDWRKKAIAIFRKEFEQPDSPLRTNCKDEATWDGIYMTLCTSHGFTEHKAQLLQWRDKRFLPKFAELIQTEAFRRLAPNCNSRGETTH